jgi:hypothetical protein
MPSPDRIPVNPDMRWNASTLTRTDAFATIAYRMIGVLCRTYRYRLIQSEQWIDLHRSGHTVLLCMWHQQFFPAFYYFSKHQPPAISIMISQSADGDIASAIAAKAGFAPVRGSSSRGGMAALKTMIRSMRKTRLAGHIVDGPQGPAGIIKPGIAAMARATGAAIVPLYAWADRTWYARSWDRFMVPKPFSRVTLTFEAPIFWKDVDRQGLEDFRRDLEERMQPHLIEPKLP